VAFIIPTTYPVMFSNFNWTPVTVGIALLIVLGAWFLPKCGALHWYHGKSHTVREDPKMVRASFSLTARAALGVKCLFSTALPPEHCFRT
jgi:hypothetical protein